MTNDVEAAALELKRELDVDNGRLALGMLQDIFSSQYSEMEVLTLVLRALMRLHEAGEGPNVTTAFFRAIWRNGLEDSPLKEDDFR